jgi:hypothetical protein
MVPGESIVPLNLDEKTGSRRRRETLMTFRSSRRWRDARKLLMVGGERIELS